MSGPDSVLVAEWAQGAGGAGEAETALMELSVRGGELGREGPRVKVKLTSVIGIAKVGGDRREPNRMELFLGFCSITQLLSRQVIL